MATKTKLPSSIEFVNITPNTFIIKKVLRFVDIDNLNKYTKRELFSILTSVNIYTNPNYKKSQLIAILNRSGEAINKIKAENREYTLQNLGI